MKKLLCLILSATFIMSVMSFGVNAEISSQAAVVYSATTEEFLYEKSSEEQLSMASTTKIMTTLLALEYIEEHGNITVEITEEMVAVEGSSMGLAAGDIVTLYDLCVGMLLPSGNDAANSVAVAIGDGDFASMMNKKAEEIGMTDTNFVTPSGLDDEFHYTTAKDMAILGAAAIENEEFLEICSSLEMQVTYTSVAKGEITVTFSNHNQLLSYMDDCIGLKTGYTSKSGRCLVTAVNRDGVILICVTLNAPDDWNDHMTLYEMCYANLKEYTPVSIGFITPNAYGDASTLSLENMDSIPYFSDEEITEKIYLPRFIYYQEGEIYGRVDYIQGDEIICSKMIVG